MNLLTELRTLFAPAVTALAPDPAKVPDYLGMVKPSGDPKNGDYQANFAMALGKTLGRKPQDVAADIVAKLPQSEMIESATVAGPGFINLKLSDAWIAGQVQKIAADDRLGVAKAAQPKTYIVEYSSPNVAKPLHVGHLRSTIIGDALARLLKFLGHTVITDNHLGDWGTQFGMLIYGYRRFLDQSAYDADPVRELARLYVHVRGLFKKAGDDEDEGPTDDPVKLACQQETAKLHAGDAANVELWLQFMPHCLEAIHRIYRRLGVLPFDHEHGESFYNPMMPEVVADMLAKGLAQESQGAVVIPNAKGNIPTADEQKTEDPPGLIRKRDGAFTYTTSDLATVKYRVDTFRPDAVLYAVDFRQALHFKTVFAQARRWGYDRVELQHVSFGSVLGKDGKPLSTRGGGAVELESLVDQAVTLGQTKYRESYAERKTHGHDIPNLADAEIDDIAQAIGIGAVKYADLCQNRTSDYKFDPEKMLATEGNTATYMQYAYARCRSIFRKLDPEDRWFWSKDLLPAQITHPAERALAVQLLKFEEVLSNAAAEYLPHYITQYLWDVAKPFSVFFVECPVLTAPSEELKQSRLLLVDLTGRVIHTALGLLGIRTVERM